jgi:hypothetical protein
MLNETVAVYSCINPPYGHAAYALRSVYQPLGQRLRGRIAALLVEHPAHTRPEGQPHGIGSAARIDLTEVGFSLFERLRVATVAEQTSDVTVADQTGGP